MVLLIPTILKDAANFELRDEVCLQLESHLSAVIFIPGTYSPSDCSESPVGFGVGHVRKWAHICAAVSRPVRLQKLRQSAEVSGGKEVWSGCCSPPLRSFKRLGKCQVRTVGHAHEISESCTFVSWHPLRGEELRAEKTKGETLYPVPSESFCTGRKC